MQIGPPIPLDYRSPAKQRLFNRWTILIGISHLLAFLALGAIWQEQVHNHMLHSDAAWTPAESAIKISMFVLAFPVLDLCIWGQRWLPDLDHQVFSVLFAASIVLLNSAAWAASGSLLLRVWRNRKTAA